MCVIIIHASSDEAKGVEQRPSPRHISTHFQVIFDMDKAPKANGTSNISSKDTCVGRLKQLHVQGCRVETKLDLALPFLTSSPHLYFSHLRGQGLAPLEGMRQGMFQVKVLLNISIFPSFTHNASSKTQRQKVTDILASVSHYGLVVR